MAVITQIIDHPDTTVNTDPLATTSAVWQGGESTRARAGRFAFPIEGSEQSGTEPQGPTPTEYLVGALLGSLTALLHRRAQENRIVLGAIESTGRVTASGSGADELSRRRARRTGLADARIDAVLVEIVLVTDADRAAVEAIEREVEASCPILTLLRDSGTRVELSWENLFA